jgi:nucleoside-diphosphate-sugar epimerase
MQKVAITGANGFTGRYLTRLLVEQGYSVHGLVHSADTERPASLECHSCYLEDLASVSRVIDTIRPDKIVHLAAVSFVAHEDVMAIYRTNIMGTRNLLQAALACGTPASAIILASSANIYGNSTSGTLTEENQLAPANDYGISKVAMEQVGRMYSDRLPIIITRPFNYTGVGQGIQFLIPKIVDHIRRRTPHIDLGNVDVARDFSDVRGVVAAYAALLEEKSAIGHTYNICSGRAYTLNDVLEMAQAIAGHRIEVRVNPAFVRANEVKMLRGSRERLDMLLPNLPNPPLEDTLRWMLDA